MIVRSKRRETYTNINNDVFKTNMSAEALGILCFLLSKPDNWQVKCDQLAAHFGCGVKVVWRVMKELVVAGFVARSKMSSGEMSYTVHESPLKPNCQNGRQAPNGQNGSQAEPDGQNGSQHISKNQLLTEKKERKKVPNTESARSRAPSTRGTRLSPGWQPSEDNLQYAMREGFAYAEAMKIAEQFRDYWIARADAGAVKLDWDATWRNWVRRVNDDEAKPRRSHQNGDTMLDLLRQVNESEARGDDFNGVTIEH